MNSTSGSGPGTPTQNVLFRHGRSMSNQSAGDSYSLKDGLQPPAKEGRDARSLSNAAAFGPRGASLAPSGPPPGSFSSDLKTVAFSRGITPRLDSGGFTSREYVHADDTGTSEQRQIELRDRINKEIKIRVGSENLLEALVSKNAKQSKQQRQVVESELNSSNRKIIALKSQLDEEIDRAKRPITPPRNRSSGLFQGSPLKSPSREEEDLQNGLSTADLDSESPTYVLAEILQALEVEGQQADYYVERANSLVELFKRHPALKYDLAWPIFGLRVQTMLLSESREVIAAGYRVTRHAIADRRSLQTIRGLNTDHLVVLSLVKDHKASIEREQALKFVRAFLDVKNGMHELSNGVIRTIVAISEHHEDRLRSMALLTISEILIREPSVVVAAGGIAPLSNALIEGSYPGPESLAIAFLYLLDKPHERGYLKSAHEMEASFTPFTDPLAMHGSEDMLRSSARLIAAVLKTWPGLVTLSSNDFSAMRSLVLSLCYPAPFSRDLLLDLLFDVLHIKPPSWTSSFLAGRRLTTYGRVANLKAETSMQTYKSDPEEVNNHFNLIEHFTTLLLAVLVHCGLPKALSDLIEDASDIALRRKATLLLSEVLKLANHSLPSTISASIQVLPNLLSIACFEGSEDGPKDGPTEGSEEGFEIHSLASTMIYQVDSVNRTLYRSEITPEVQSGTTTRNNKLLPLTRSTDPVRTKLSVDMDDLKFRSLLLETQVLATVNFIKWKWDLINDLIEGPLLNPRRLEEAIKTTKFMKRLTKFYRPFKYKFSDVKNTKPNQRYVRTGCALIRTLLQNQEGIAFLSEDKLLRQVAECLAQVDRVSGLTAAAPMFSFYRISDTLCGGYFALLGAMSNEPQGLQIIERWHMTNMFYHIMDLSGRDDLVRTFLSNMNFTLDSHLRVMLSKALTACPKTIRIYATKLLRKYATVGDNGPGSKAGHSEWAIRLLVTQLYDPEVEVCEVAVQILEETCNRKAYLEYVVRCRPALDHLGEIGAPLLLRFLSTSLGYQYLDGLDYIGQEMDDWFLGRNDTYVTLVEASISRAVSVHQERPKSIMEDNMKSQDYGLVPPHFYRELTRTVEGCSLLTDSGHFNEFVSVIRDSWSEHEDPETMLKVKGCLWAVGNVGSMELGAPFLEDSDVVAWIVKIATGSEVMTMRGTAFFVLGLISRSLHGMEILAEHGWNAAADGMGHSRGYCLPPDLNALFSVSKAFSQPRPRKKC